MRFDLGLYILDDENRPIKARNVIEWGRFLNENGTRRIVDWTQVNSQVYVSTIFLGLDHRYSGDGPPIVFETMIFGGKMDQSQWRYASWDDAKAGHAMAVKKARTAAGQKPRAKIRQ